MINISILNGINSAIDFCNQALIIKLAYYVGVVLMVLRITIPIALIVLGSFELTKAITLKNDTDISKALASLAKKVVIGVAVFLVPTIVTLLMGIIGQNDYENCMSCINNAFGSSCKTLKTVIPYAQTCEGSGGTLEENKCVCSNPEDKVVKNSNNEEYCTRVIEVEGSTCIMVEALLVDTNVVELSKDSNWNGIDPDKVKWIKYNSMELSDYTINSLEIEKIKPLDPNMGETVELSAMNSTAGEYKVYYKMKIKFKDSIGKMHECTTLTETISHFVKVK